MRRKAAADRMESQDDAFHERVRAGFRTEAQRRPERIVVIDAGQTLEQVQTEIRGAVKRLL